MENRTLRLLLAVTLCLGLSCGLMAASPQGSVSVSYILPNTGPLAGGTAVQITGTGFLASPTVTFGGVAATGVLAVNAGLITCTTPAHAAGAVDIVVTNTDASTGTGPGLFTYVVAPTVTGVTPNSGPSLGGTPVTVAGTGFSLTGTTTVTFGGTAATSVSVTAAGTLTCTTPGHAVGAVNVIVTNPDSQFGTLNGGYTYNASASPTVTSIVPASGSTNGSTGVTLTGTGFASGATVAIGGNPATNVAFVSATSVTCTTPAHAAAGAVNVVLTNPDTLSGTLTGGYTYTASPAPTVTSVTPNSGSAAGGTGVTVAGTGFASGAAVSFGGSLATSVTVVNSTSITCATPAHAAGAVSVVVTNPDTQASAPLASGFTYTAATAPTVTAVDPAVGPTTGGQSVTLTGTTFLTGATVKFGTVAATSVVVANATTITCVTPAHAAGAVDVVVTNPDALSGTKASGYTYTTAPTLTTIVPASGPIAGGQAVTITGTNFFTGATVKFGATAATSVVVASATSITCITPAHAAGAVDVVVTNADAQAGTKAAGYTYTTAPIVVSINPVSGPAAGGQSVTITGGNFLAGATVRFDTAAATSVVVTSTTSITCTTPAHAAGAVNVVVTNADAQFGTLAGGYTFTAPPCDLTCTATVPATGYTLTPTPFQASATATGGCTGVPAYLWTFGDTQGAAVQNIEHTYNATGDYSWSLTASLQGTTCSKYGTIHITPYVAPPVISGVTKVVPPTAPNFRLKIYGSNFHPGCIVKIGGIAVPTTTYKSGGLVVAKGSTVKSMVPKGVTVQVTVTNVDDGGVSASFPYTR